jgi:hypothetical protein
MMMSTPKISPFYNLNKFPLGLAMMNAFALRTKTKSCTKCDVVGLMHINQLIHMNIITIATKTTTGFTILIVIIDLKYRNSNNIKFMCSV